MSELGAIVEEDWSRILARDRTLELWTGDAPSDSRERPRDTLCVVATASLVLPEPAAASAQPGEIGTGLADGQPPW